MVKTWDSFYIQAAKLIQYSFVKTKLLPLTTPTGANINGLSCMAALQYGTGEKHKLLHLITYPMVPDDIKEAESAEPVNTLKEKNYSS